MTNDQNNPHPEAKPDVEALYSESFARERARRSRRGSLVCGIGSMLLGIVVIHDTVSAIRTGKLVAIGRWDHWPPFIAGPIGVFALLVGIWFLAGLIFERE